MSISVPETPGTHLPEEVEAARALLNILEQEQAHLIEADVEALETLVTQKSELISRMTSFANARHKALGKAGFPSEEASMEKWLESSDSLQTERSKWDELVELVKSSKEVNRRNGLLINKHIARNQNALQILQQEQPSNTYGPDGHARLNQSGRGIVAG